MNTRTCRHCNLVDLLENFPIADIVKGKTYYRHLCNKCYAKQKHTERNIRIKKFRDYKKTLCCSKCGYDDYRALQFHHINDDKESNVCNIVRNKSWENVLEEINKCIVLCANCHQIHHYEERDITKNLGSNPSIPIASFMTGTLDLKLKSFYNNKVNKSKQCL
jgi:hypothetical protein